MYFRIVVLNCDDQLVKYEWDDASQFMEVIESESISIDTPCPMLDDPVMKLDYAGADIEVHWNENDLHHNGIVTVNGLYNWLCSEDCDWFDT